MRSSQPSFPTKFSIFFLHQSSLRSRGSSTPQSLSASGTLVRQRVSPGPFSAIPGIPVSIFERSVIPRAVSRYGKVDISPEIHDIRFPDNDSQYSTQRKITSTRESRIESITAHRVRPAIPTFTEGSTLRIAAIGSGKARAKHAPHSVHSDSLHNCRQISCLAV